MGAGGGTIKKHGTCLAMLRDKAGRKVKCNWAMADVTRSLHSVSQVCGPIEGDGDHNVMFTNKRCVVVPAGVVEKALALMKVDPITEYQRDGGLYTAELELSDFGRQGQQR